MKSSKSLRDEFFRTLLLVTALGGLATLGIVVVLSAQASSRQLASVQRYIEEGSSSKGRVLTQNHALALRGLTPVCVWDYLGKSSSEFAEKFELGWDQVT